MFELCTTPCTGAFRVELSCAAAREELLIVWLEFSPVSATACGGEGGVDAGLVVNVGFYKMKKRPWVAGGAG